MLYARDFRSRAYNALSGKWALAVGTGFVAALLGDLSGPLFRFCNNTFWRDNSDSVFHTFLLPYYFGLVAIGMILALISFFIGGAITLGYSKFNKNMIKGTNPQFGDLFSDFHIFWKAFLMQLLTAIIIFVGFILFIIPGIIAVLSLSMAPYILDDNPEMSVIDAMKRSYEMMQGNKWRLFCLNISFIGWAILCIFTCGIGFLWLTPYTWAAEAAFYLEISGFNAYNNQGYTNGYNSHNNGDFNNSYNNQSSNNGYNNDQYNNNQYNNNFDNGNNGYNNNYNPQNDSQKDSDQPIL